MSIKKASFFILIILLISVSLSAQRKNTLPIVAIANYGPHASLEASIEGIKAELEQEGFKDKENIDIQITDVGFDLALIPQMIAKLKSKNPKIIVAVGTPIAQYAKNIVKEIPLVFTDITDPVAAGLLETQYQSIDNITGASDKQDLDVLMSTIKEIIPYAKKMGVLYTINEDNDIALINMLKNIGKKYKIEIIDVPVEQARDVALRVQLFKNKVDFIYVGASGAIQPALPAIVVEADKLGIPVFNVDKEAVLEQQVLASIGVDYYQVGLNTGKIVARILQGESIETISPIFPTEKTHQSYISSYKANQFNIVIPTHNKITVVE